MKKILFIAIISILMISLKLNAQIKDRTTIDTNISIKNRWWYCNANYEYQSPYSMLTAIPPLSSDMPYEIMLSYIYSDSLLRSVTRDEFYNKLSYWENNRIKNDTVINFIKYFYMVQDYNPIIFNQSTQYESKPRYKMRSSIFYEAIPLLQSIIGEDSISQSLNVIQRPDYILRVKINSIIDSMPSKLSPDNTMLYYVNATVIDTLKGKVFYNCQQNNYNYNYKLLSDSIYKVNPQICFVYAKGPYWKDANNKIDSTLLNSNGNLTLTPGQDLIITLSLELYLLDYNYDYFQLSLVTAMPIINNQFKDNNYIWGNSLFIDYDSWKSIFFQRKQLLLNGGY